MLKRLALLLMLLLLAGQALADAPVHVDEPAPADWETRDDILRIDIFKVYRSDAAVLSCGGVSLAIDGSEAKNAEKLATAYLNYGYVRDGHPYVDYMLATHPHNDHIEGLYTMVNHFGLSAGEFLTSFRLDYRNDYQQRALASMENHGIPVRLVEQGDVIELGGVVVRLFWNANGKNPNALSCMAHVEYGEATALFTADCTGIAQRDLMKQVPEEWLKADVMKMAHHAVTAMVKEFLDLVSPDYIWVTNSERNEGVISAAVNQIRSRKIPFDYSYNGHIVLLTDGQEWYINQLNGEI